MIAVSRALILGPGGLQGAYSGGVVATLGRKLGRNYFNSLYGCSAGAYTGSYLVSDQPDLIEVMWRECVFDKRLIRWQNILHRGQPILDLFYLDNVLRNDPYRLSIENLLNSPVKMFIVTTECRTGTACYFSPKTPKEFFLQVRASAAVPYLHPEVLIDGLEYVDGGLSDPLPIEKALADGHDEVVVVCNTSQLALNRPGLVLSTIGAMGYPGRQAMLRSLAKQQRVASLVEKNRAQIRIIFPSAEPPLRWHFDSSKTRINQLVDLGIRDALAFLKT